MIPSCAISQMHYTYGSVVQNKTLKRY